MRQEIETPKKARSKKRQPKFQVNVLGPCLIAHGGDPSSSFLLFNPSTGSYHAWTNEWRIWGPPLAKAPYADPSDCPVDDLYLPKSEILMILAVRGRAKELAPGSNFVANSNREYALRMRRRELSKEGITVSEKNWAACLKMASDTDAFEKWVANHLMLLLQHDDCAEKLIRLGQWMKKTEHIEREEIPPHYLRFHQAVELAAHDSGLVPTQKSVRAIYEKGLSANQLGGGHGFRSTMIKLAFDWLPAGGRGKR
jgi:hypothetical protein